MTTARSILALPFALLLLAGCGDDTKTLEAADLEEQVLDQIVEQEMVGGTPVLTCEDDLVIEVGNTVECVGTVEEAPGEETPITVEVLDEDGELEVTIGDGE